MVCLGDKTHGRENNLNLIRSLAAAAVLVSHAWPISLGSDAVQPLKSLTNHSLGTLSVSVFFAISGFLISMSFERTSSTLSFVLARFLRLFPGLVVSLFLVAFLLGPIVTTLGTNEYFTQFETYTFVPRNVLLLPLQFTLPGVFEMQPYPAVEGSIWTLFYEVLCYVGVFALGISGILRKRGLMAVSLIVYLVIWICIDLDNTPGRIGRIAELSLPFVIGMSFYIWRDRLPLSLIVVVGLVATTAITANTPVYNFMLALTLSYATFWAAYIPGGFLRYYNDFGDYSYGLYIYAFPLQGLVIWIFGTQEPLFNIAVSFPITLVVAIASWHLIEAPAMRTKSKLIKMLTPHGFSPELPK